MYNNYCVLCKSVECLYNWHFKADLNTSIVVNHQVNMECHIHLMFYLFIHEYTTDLLTWQCLWFVWLPWYKCSTHTHFSLFKTLMRQQEASEWHIIKFLFHRHNNVQCKYCNSLSLSPCTAQPIVFRERERAREREREREGGEKEG